MPRMVLVDDPQDVSPLQDATALTSLDVADLKRDMPDAHWVLLNNEGQRIGRYSLWWRQSPPHGDHRVGVIGHYAACHESAARQLLDHACRELVERGCTLAIGPMNGNTWRSYRFVTNSGAEAPFFLEPTNPPQWPKHFLQSGFQVLAEYFSALDDDLARRSSRADEVAARMRRTGVSIRRFDLQQFAEELARIHTVATSCFQNNLMYQPITLEDFIDLYRPLQRVVNGSEILIAEHRNEPVGFLFAVADLCQARRGAAVDTLIVKSLAVQPTHALAGVGYLLLEHMRAHAREHGYRRLIHALVRDAGHLRRLSERFARPIRRYALFAKDLRP